MFFFSVGNTANGEPEFGSSKARHWFDVAGLVSSTWSGNDMLRVWSHLRCPALNNSLTMLEPARGTHQLGASTLPGSPGSTVTGPIAQSRPNICTEY